MVYSTAFPFATLLLRLLHRVRLTPGISKDVELRNSPLKSEQYLHQGLVPSALSRVTQERIIGVSSMR